MKNLIIFLFCLPLSLYSQVPHTTYVTGYAGLSIPSNQNGYTFSFNTGSSIEVAVSRLAVLGAEANFTNLSSGIKYDSPIGMHPAIVGYVEYRSGNYSTMGISAFVKLQNAEAANLPVQTFVKLGIGASMISQTKFTMSDIGVNAFLPSLTSTGFLFSPAVGANIMLHGKNKIVIEAQYRINKSGSQDVRMFLVNAGYSFRL